MSSIKIFNNLKSIQSKDSELIKLVSNAELSVSDGSIELKTNGIPSSIIINYKGIGSFNRIMPLEIKTKIGKSTIFINNPFRVKIPKILYTYVGDITIYDCQIMNMDCSRVKATINNHQNEGLIDKSETKIEDETLILYDQPKFKIKRPFKGGYVSPVLGKKIKKQSYKENRPLKKEQRTGYSKPIAKPIAKPIVKPIVKPQKQENAIKYEGGKK